MVHDLLSSTRRCPAVSCRMGNALMFGPDFKIRIAGIFNPEIGDMIVIAEEEAVNGELDGGIEVRRDRAGPEQLSRMGSVAYFEGLIAIAGISECAGFAEELRDAMPGPAGNLLRGDQDIIHDIEVPDIIAVDQQVGEFFFEGELPDKRDPVNHAHGLCDLVEINEKVVVGQQVLGMPVGAMGHLGEFLVGIIQQVEGPAKVFITEAAFQGVVAVVIEPGLGQGLKHGGWV